MRSHAATAECRTCHDGAVRHHAHGNVEWGAMASAGVIGALPIVVFSAFVQRHLVRGLTMGAVK